MLEPVIQVLTHPQYDGCIGGLIGAFLLVAASIFVSIGLPLKDLNLAKKAVFLLGGALLALVIDISPTIKEDVGIKDVDVFYGLCVGAGWPYLMVGIVAAVMTFAKGLAAQKAEQVAVTLNPGGTGGSDRGAEQ